MIEGVNTALTEFATKAELMSAAGVGKNISEVPSHVVTAFRRGKTDLFEPADDYVGSAGNWVPSDGRVWTQEKPQCLGIEAVVEVAENLIEIVHAGQQLVCHCRCDYGIQYGRIVIDVKRGHLKIILEVGTSGAQGRTAAERSGLAPLTEKASHIKVIFLVEIVVNLQDAVVAIPSRGNRAEEIVQCGGQTPTDHSCQ